MTNTSRHSDNGDFTPPGAVRVSSAALQFARQFQAAAKGHGDYVVTFDWAETIKIRRGPGEPLQDVGACLMLGGYDRRHIPVGFTQTADGLEFAVKIPHAVVEKSVRRLIDVDADAMFKLTLL